MSDEPTIHEKLQALDPDENITDTLKDLAEDYRLRALDAEAENARLREESDDYEKILDRQSELLTGVAASLKGPPPELTLHNHADLPEVAAAIVAERDRLRRHVDDAYEKAHAKFADALQIGEEALAERDRLRTAVARLWDTLRAVRSYVTDPVGVTDLDGVAYLTDPARLPPTVRALADDVLDAHNASGEGT